MDHSSAKSSQANADGKKDGKKTEKVNQIKIQEASEDQQNSASPGK